MIPRSSTLVLALFLSSEALVLPTQSQDQSTAQTPPDQSTYTFQTNTRVVLTDVTVTDGGVSATLALLNQYAAQFADSASAYTLTADSSASSAGTLLQLAASH